MSATRTARYLARMEQRHYTPVDHLVMNVDQALRTLLGRPPVTGRPNPADGHGEGELTDQERVEAARLMRVNHAGEVSAQALYQGQALTARLDRVRDRMEQAALEENDHLAWCEDRIKALGGHTSYLNPAWYVGSLSIGALAGLIGDKWSLGFVAETEQQVIHHLDGHLQRLSMNDLKSRAVLEQMRVDEAHHGTAAMESGGVALPGPVKGLMSLVSRLMTRTAYWV